MSMNKKLNALTVIFTLVTLSNTVLAIEVNHSLINFSGAVLPSSCSVEVKNKAALHLKCQNGHSDVMFTNTKVVENSDYISSSSLKWIDNQHVISTFEYN